jgi:dolichol-phosphate mannosyltransferase
MNIKVSVIIPTKNEPYIATLVKKIHKCLHKINHETPHIENAKIVKQKSNGLGRAILEGLRHAKGDIIVTMDGDGSHRPCDILRLLKGISNGYDIVIGSRFIKGGKTLDIKHRKIVSYIMRKFVSIFLNLNIKDSMSGFCAAKREVYEKINLKPIGYKINMELMYKGKKHNFKICEVPIIFEQRKSGESKVGFNLRGLKEIFHIFVYAIELKLRMR